MKFFEYKFLSIQQICSEYEKISGHTLERAITKEFSGDIMVGGISDENLTI